MQYRKLGHSEISVSTIGMGCVTFVLGAQATRRHIGPDRCQKYVADRSGSAMRHASLATLTFQKLLLYQVLCAMKGRSNVGWTFMSVAWP